jgi:hypothetical protein
MSSTRPQVNELGCRFMLRDAGTTNRFGDMNLPGLLNCLFEGGELSTAQSFRNVSYSFGFLLSQD